MINFAVKCIASQLGCLKMWLIQNWLVQSIYIINVTFHNNSSYIQYIRSLKLRKLQHYIIIATLCCGINHV